MKLQVLLSIGFFRLLFGFVNQYASYKRHPAIYTLTQFP